MSATSRRKKLSATFWSKILEINSIMGRANGKPVLSDEDLEFIAKHTAVSRDQIDEQYENFLGKHPNGKITKEFMMVLYIMSNGTPEENLKQIFRVFDINNDGKITLKELQKIVRDLFLLINESNADKASQEVLVKSTFNEMDENHDGKISQSEFVEACMAQRNFSTMLTLKIIDVFITEEAHGRASVTQRPPSLASIEKTK